ncbi:tetratricopeptide (TPR) repeat protein [Kocuria marina]
MAPDIDADVTGREIDRTVRRELQALEASNAERVSKHLVMAARYLDDDPEFALEHANAAVRKAGRIGAVREVAGIAAYAAGDYALALKELRTHRRISGSQAHLPLMVDAQRALGRVDKAMEEATSDAADALDAEGKAELAMVVSGIHADAGDEQAALAALEIPQLDKNRGFSYSPKLFRAYADALRAVGRDSEAMSWDRQAIVAEAALGMGQFSEPEIVDLGDDLDENDARRTVREAQKRHSADRPGDDAPAAGADFDRDEAPSEEDAPAEGGAKAQDASVRKDAPEEDESTARHDEPSGDDDAPVVSTDSDEEAVPAREETAPSDDAAAPGDASADNHAPAESTDGERGMDTGHDRN